MQCPKCQIDLQRERSLMGALWQCPQCHGVAANLAVLRKLLEQDVVQDFWKRARTSTYSSRLCPSCCQSLKVFTHLLDENPMTLDICKRCQIIWFGKKQLEAFPVRAIEVGETRSNTNTDFALAKLNLDKYLPEAKNTSVFKTLMETVDIVFQVLYFGTI